MEQVPTANPETEVTRDDLETHIAAIERRLVPPIEGVFGTHSITWRVNRESALFLGAGRAALLQLAHPWVAAAIDQHSSVLDKPIARFHNTFRIVFTMIFGTREQAIRASRSLYQLHTRIVGEVPVAVAGYAKGSRYEALHVPALRWVHATLIESAVIAYETVLPALNEAEREAYYGETKVLASLFGIPPEALPAGWSSFKTYIAEMCQSQALGVSERSRIMGQRIMSGAESWLHIPQWYRALTAEWMPPRFREGFDLDFGPSEQGIAQRARRWLPRVYVKLPFAVRCVGPYQEAHARLADRAPGLLTRQSNQFWIGDTRMPFGD
jgi:uncharacterized protein (DUF2236 family)